MQNILFCESVVWVSMLQFSTDVSLLTTIILLVLLPTGYLLSHFHIVKYSLTHLWNITYFIQGVKIKANNNNIWTAITCLIQMECPVFFVYSRYVKFICLSNTGIYSYCWLHVFKYHIHFHLILWNLLIIKSSTKFTFITTK